MDEIKKKYVVEADLLEMTLHFLAAHRIIMTKMMQEEPGLAALAMPNLLRVNTCTNSLEELTQTKQPKTSKELRDCIPKQIQDIVDTHFNRKDETK